MGLRDSSVPVHRRHVTHPAEASTAAGIYGVIVGAAVVAASHEATAVAVVVSVLVTLVIYWAAERYAGLVAQRIHSKHRPSRREVTARLTSGWEIVTASALPLATLLVLKALGLRLYVAELGSLATSTLLLLVAGWEMGRGGSLTVVERVLTTTVAGLFGAGMIVLKALLH